ncbi:MAG: amino acid permease [Bacteroidia bacterium]|nr:amino acid permease [Bacteroidia bacterium]
MENVTHKGLKKSFGLRMAIVIVISSIIGSGVFKKVAPMSDTLGSPLLVVAAFALAGLLTLFGMWSIAELGSMYPESGGPFAWLEKIYGKTISFLYGWASFTVIQSAAIASIAFVFAGAIGTYIELPHLPEHLASFSILGIQPLDNIGAKLIACALIAILSLVNIRGAKWGGNLSMIFTVIIILCILMIVMISFGSSVGNAHTFTTPSTVVSVEKLSLWGLIGAIIVAMRHAFWAYEGWMSLGFVGEELEKPEKDISRAVTIGLLIIVFLYVLVNAAYLYVMPIDDIIRETTKDENKIAAVLVIDKIFGNGGAHIISSMILIATLGCTNATILASARIYYAMAKKGLFFERIKKTHSKYNTPHNSLILQCVWACLLVFSGSFDLLTDLVVIVAFSFYGLIVFGVIILRKKASHTTRPYKTIGYPVIPIIFCIFCIVLLVVTFIESPEKSFTGLFLIFSGLPFYYFWKKKLSKALSQ